MAAQVILVEATPRTAADGAPVTVRLAGAGGNRPYLYGGQHWRAGIAGLPKSIGSLDFDGEQPGGGGISQALELRWSPAGNAALAEMAALYWGDARITVRVGEEGDVMPSVLAQGLVLSAAVDGGGLRIALADATADLKRPILTERFGGTGGIDGPIEFDGMMRPRAWGRCFNVPGKPIDQANHIWCFGDPSRPWGAFDQVRDMGVAATAVTTLDWQGSAAATFTALQAAPAPAGGCVTCAPIACVKWWTEPGGDLHADIRGEVTGGYVETAPEIAARIAAVRSPLGFAPGTIAAAVAARPAAIGWRVDSESVTAASALSEMLGDVSLSWLVIDGAIVLRAWDWTPAVRFARSHAVSRREVVKPIGTRRLGYRRNWRPMARGDLAAIVLSRDVVYEDGSPIEDWKPAAPGATPGAPAGTFVGGVLNPITGEVVGGRPAQQVAAELDRIEPIEIDLGNLDDAVAEASAALDTLQAGAVVTDAALAVLEAVAEAHDDALDQLRAADLAADVSLAKLAAAEADIEAAMRQATRDLGQIEEGLLRALMESARTRKVLRDAGIVVDQGDGTVRIYAIDKIEDRVSKAEVELDGQSATITTKASVNYVDEQIILAVLDPAQVAQLEPVLARLTTAETIIDGLNAQLALKAAALELTAVAGKVTTVEQALTALTGEIVTKASATSVDALETRTGFVEQTLSALPDLSGFSVTIRQARAVADDAAEAALLALLAGDVADRRQIVQIAEVRQETFTRISEGLSVEALARRALAVEVGQLDARLVEQLRVLADEDGVQAERIDALSVSSQDQAAAIGTLTTASIGAAGGIAGVRTTIRQIVRGADDGDEAVLRSLIAGDAATRDARAQVAQVRSDVTTRLVAGEVSAAATKQLLEVRLGQAETFAASSVETLTEVDRAQATKIDALDASLVDLDTGLVNVNSRITNLATATATQDAANAGLSTALSAQLNDPATGLPATRTTIVIDRQASVARDGALATEIDALTVVSAGQAAAIGELSEASIDAAGGLARVSTTIRQVAGQSDTGDEAVLRSLIAGDEASRGRRAQIVQIQTEFSTALTANESASAVARQSLTARIALAEASIFDVSRVLADTEQSLVERVAAGEAVFADAVTGVAATRARLIAEESLRAAGDIANAEAIEVLSAQVNAAGTGLPTAVAQIAAVERASVDRDQANAQATAQVLAQLNDPATGLPVTRATIANDRQASADRDAANARATEEVAAQLNDPATGLPVTRAVAAVDRQARVNGDAANAQAVEQVTARLDGVGSVGVEQAIAATVNRLGQIEGRYTVTIDVNGNLTGFQLIGGASGPGSLNLVNTDLRMGTGRIVFDNGSAMRVQGTGFGIASDLITWFGPTMAITQCSRSNAISYEATNGDAYFGGSLTAGTLRTAQQSPSTAANVVVDTGKIGSNGGIIVITASWSFTSFFEKFYPATNQALNEFYADAASNNATSADGFTFTSNATRQVAQTTLALSRGFFNQDGSVSTTAAASIASTTSQVSFFGERPTPGDEPGRARFGVAASASFTFTDPAQSSADRQFRLELARGGDLGTQNIAQRLSLITTEE